LAGPNGHVITCGIYRAQTGIEVRCGYKRQRSRATGARIPRRDRPRDCSVWKHAAFDTGSADPGECLAGYWAECKGIRASSCTTCGAPHAQPDASPACL